MCGDVPAHLGLLQHFLHDAEGDIIRAQVLTSREGLAYNRSSRAFRRELPAPAYFHLCRLGIKGARSEEVRPCGGLSARWPLPR